MNETQIREAIERATAVVDGFRCNTERTARDAQRLGRELLKERAECQAARQELERLKSIRGSLGDILNGVQL